MTSTALLRRVAFLICLLIASAFSVAQTHPAPPPLAVVADHPDGIYKVGEKVTWSVLWTGSETQKQLTYSLKRGERTEIDKGTIDLKDGGGKVESKFDEPGTLLLEVRWNAEPKPGFEPRALGGAVAGISQLKLSAPRPDDFDAFWDSKIAELQAVPANPKLDKAESDKPNVDYYKITMDNIRGTHIRGQLARPTSGEKFPAILQVQWAGVYPLEKPWVTDRARDGWLALNINAHDLPIDEPRDFYKQQFDGPLKNYWSIGNDDRDTSYFLRMYLSCYRAVEYLMTRDDWDGKTLVVMGGSQGGLQTLMICGLHPEHITAGLADVPAGCDMLGPQVDRKGGWPQWYDNVEGKDPAKVREASRYYDVANFATKIKCPVLVGAGLIDETCPPEGILATTNVITSPKEIRLFPNGGHQDVRGSHDPYSKRCWSAWLPALVKGDPAPVAAE